MKYYTPELFVRFNSQDVDEAMCAHDDWDQADKNYESRLRVIRRSLPKSVLYMADQLCLHDAEIVALVQLPSFLQILTRSESRLCSLEYHLVSPAKISVPVSSDVFWPQFPRWLYDEIDLVRAETYTHSILLSDGRVIEAEFDKLDISEFELHPAGTAEKLRAVQNVLDIAEQIASTKGKSGKVTIPDRDVKKLKRAMTLTKTGPAGDPIETMASKVKITSAKIAREIPTRRGRTQSARGSRGSSTATKLKKAGT